MLSTTLVLLNRTTSDRLAGATERLRLGGEVSREKPVLVPDNPSIINHVSRD